MEIDFGQRLRQVIEETKNPKTISPTPVKWSDPREDDLPEDSAAWSDFMVYFAHDQELFSLMNTIRACGTRLERGKAFYKIKPIIDPTGRTGWENEDDYLSAKKEMLKWSGTIEVALRRLHESRCSAR